jgi:nitric oxide reductase NorD protein
MEEFVGGVWDRIVNRAAGGHYPAAAATLKEMEGTLGILYRAFGGDAGLRVGGAAEVRHGAQRKWLSRLAGSDERVALASVSEEALRLPATIDCFSERELNRDLYIWLAALAGCDVAPGAPWLERNRAASHAALTRYPGLAARYRRLVAAHIATRISPEKLPPAEAAQERAICLALTNPGGSDDSLQDPTAGAACQSGPSAPQTGSSGTEPGAALRSGSDSSRTPAKPPQPVLLWLSPESGERAAGADEATPAEQALGGQPSDADTQRAHKSERVEMPQPKSPFVLMFRAESLLTWGEYLHVNRALDDEPDPNAKDVARDMDHLSLARGGPPAKSKVRFDLDLPSAAADDIRLGDGIPLPEWDYRQGRLVADYCRLQPMLARDATAQALPAHLLRPARKLRQRFSALVGARRWQRAQFDGEEIDLDACVRFFVEQRAATGEPEHAAGAAAGRHGGAAAPERGLYAQRQTNERDLACLLLADLSMSTDAFISDQHRVIDVVRDSAFLFCEALAATGDRFGVYGFSSVKRNHVRLHVVKDFAARYDGLARGRIAALKPGYYTRMGAAIRQASRILAEQPAARRLLLLISDGKPNDLDQYDSRYGIEDTRMAIVEARRLGLTPFCVTIDRDGGGYLPHLFGQKGYAMVSDPEELPSRLPKLYAQISGHS